MIKLLDILREIKVNNPTPLLDQLKQWLKQNKIGFFESNYQKNRILIEGGSDLNIDFDTKTKTFEIGNPYATMVWDATLEETKEFILDYIIEK